MKTNRPELLRKLNSIVNRYGGDENFVSHIDEWPKTVKELIYSSTELMIRFRLVELIPEPCNSEDVII